MSTNNNGSGSDISWAVIVLSFVLFWPVGVFLLGLKLKEEAENSGGQQDWQAAMDDVRREARRVKSEFQKGIDDLGRPQQNRTSGTYQAHTYTQRSARARMGMEPQRSAQQNKSSDKAAKSKKSKSKIRGGKGLMIAGIILAVLFGLTTVNEFSSYLDWGLLKAVQESLLTFAMTGVGAGMALFGAFRNRQARQFRKLVNMIGDSKQVDIQVLAEASSRSYNQTCDTLQDMIDKGILGERAYIDQSTGTLMLDGKGLGERKARKKAPAPEQSQNQEQDEEMRILAEIRRVNDDIPDPALTRKIDRIEEITRHIFDYQKKHPDKAGELHKFLNYYLPTTLKILNSYAELDRQGVDGSNISTTKERIERMMDQVVEGFETQLDKLFEGEMLDISSDIAVMERMLSHDGLAGGMKMPKAGESQQDGGIHLTLDPYGTAAPTAEPAHVSSPADFWTAPVTEPMTEPSADAMPGIQLTLDPEGIAGTAKQATSGANSSFGAQTTDDAQSTPDAQSSSAAQAAPGWESGFYHRTKEELE